MKPLFCRALNAPKIKPSLMSPASLHSLLLGGTLILALTCSAAPFQWETTGSLNLRRAGHAAALLSNGQVLVAGGENEGGLNSAELYDPVTGLWQRTADMHHAHAYTAATVLLDGRVLVVAGAEAGLLPSRSTELYDPASGTWSLAGQLAFARQHHTVTRLSDGKVLAVGGAGLTTTRPSPAWSFTIPP